MRAKTLGVFLLSGLLAASPLEAAKPKTARSAKVSSAKPTTKAGLAKKPTTKRVRTNSPRKRVVKKKVNSFTAAIRKLIRAMGVASRASFAAIKSLYSPLKAVWSYTDLDHLKRETLGTEENKNSGIQPSLVRIPDNRKRFNIVLRREGKSAIGAAEKDPANRIHYEVARPFAVGALMYIADQVKSGPVDITSAARDEVYQFELLSKINRNARTSFAAHTLGIAIDIGLLNTPPNTVEEIHKVIVDAREKGKIEVIGELSQLCFHFVPRPEAQAEFEAYYWQKIAEPQPNASTNQP